MQHDHVTRAQLLAMGVHPRAIDRRIEAGDLFVEYPGVYALGHRRLHPIERAHAAVLACGPGAALSHSSAAFLWGMVKRLEEPIEVTVPRDRRPAGLRVHRCKLRREDVRTHHGMLVTSPARTALDMSPRLSYRQLTRMIAEARRAGYLHLNAIRELLSRIRPRHPGATRLNTIVERAPTNPTRSGFEDAFLEFARRHGLPTPEVNTRVAGWEVDVLFPRERVIVELDGWEYHRDRPAFEADRERDAATTALGCVTVRITEERFEREPAREAERLHEILRARRRPPSPAAHTDPPPTPDI